MKPKTKKTIIIVLAVLIVAAIVYFAFFRKASKNLIDKLTVSDGVKALLRKKVAEIEAYAAENPGDENSNDWSKQGLQNKATANGRTYVQQLVIEAAYNLYTIGQLSASEYAQIESEVMAKSRL